MEQEYIITVFSENKVGLLSQITTVFTCRDVNIESLTTSESALQGIHKFTIVVRTTPDQVDKLVRQVEKKIDVLKTFVYTPDEVVQQEIALYKVARSRNVERLVREHNVRILEIDAEYIVRLGANPDLVTVTGNTKFDQTAFSVAGRLRDVDIVVTDVKPSEKWLKLFEEEGVECRYPESVR